MQKQTAFESPILGPLSVNFCLRSQYKSFQVSIVALLYHFSMMPFGVDLLGTLTEKLKQLTSEAQEQHSSLTELAKLYKEQKINENDFFSKILKYVITDSALTFLKLDLRWKKVRR
jgi:hypothetical protein